LLAASSSSEVDQNRSSPDEQWVNLRGRKNGKLRLVLTYVIGTADGDEMVYVAFQPGTDSMNFFQPLNVCLPSANSAMTWPLSSFMYATPGKCWFERVRSLGNSLDVVDLDGV
jgi:hypothetical protein